MRWLDVISDVLLAVSGRLRRWRNRHKIAASDALFARVSGKR